MPEQEKVRVYIDRNRWLRGEGDDRSRLLRSIDRKMCCLGFTCLVLGKTEDDITDLPSPSSTTRIALDDSILGYADPPGRGTVLVVDDTPRTFSATCIATVADMMEINDNRHVDADTREGKLIDLAASIGLEFVFGDGPPEQTDAPA